MWQGIMNVQNTEAFCHSYTIFVTTTKLIISWTTKWEGFFICSGLQFLSTFPCSLKFLFFFFCHRINALVCDCDTAMLSRQQAGGEMTLQGENQNQLQLGRIGFQGFYRWQASGEKMAEKWGRMAAGSEWWCRRQRRESAPRSVCENQWPPGRAAELNYQENTVAKGSRKGYSIDLSHSGSGEECKRRGRGAANGKQGEKKEAKLVKGANKNK